jgi:hypothetical protein
VVTGGAPDGGRRRHARRGGVAAARGRLPDVERQGEDSGSGVAVGGRIGRRVEQVQGGAELQVHGKRPAAAVTHARRGAEEIGGSGKTMEDPVAKSRQNRDLTVMYRLLSNQCSNGDGPKSKSV